MRGISKLKNLNRAISKKLLLVFLILIASAFSVYGFSTLSISTIDFQSNDPVLGGRAFLLSVVEDGSSQYAVGEISANQIQADGYRAKNSLKIETNVNEQSCDYSLKVAPEDDIYRLSYKKSTHYYWDVNEDSDQAIQQCKNNPSYATHFTTTEFRRDLYCITYQVLGVPGQIQTPSTNFNADVIVTSHGDRRVGKIGSQSDRSVSISNVAHAKWTGNLVSGEQCPNLGSEGFKVIHDSSGQWKLTRTLEYGTYASRLGDYYNKLRDVKFSSNLQVSSPEISSFLSAISSSNSAATLAASPKSYSKPVSITSNSLSNGQMKLQLNKLIQFPVITMRVNADWLGIFLPVGEPQITEASSPVFTEGTEGKIDITIKNKGEVDASFSASVSCPDPFRMLGTSPTIRIPSGSTRQVSIPITATTNQEISRSCTVTVHDVENPERRDTKTVTVRATPIAVCVPAQERCTGQKAEICNNQGNWEQDLENPLRCVSSPGDEQKAREECEKLGGKVIIKETNPPAWKFWEDSETTFICRIPRTPALAIVAIIAGFGLLIWMGITGGFTPPFIVIAVLLEIIGWIWLAIGRAGI